MKLKMSVRKKKSQSALSTLPKMHPNPTDFFLRNKPTLHIQVVQMSLDHRWPWRRICPVMSWQFRNEVPLSFFCRCFICIDNKKEHDQIWMEILRKSSWATKIIFIAAIFFRLEAKESRVFNCHWQHETFLFEERVVSLPQKKKDTFYFYTTVYSPSWLCKMLGEKKKQKKK
jgi:hypothetical protein